MTDSFSITNQIARNTYITFAAIILAWTTVWLLKIQLDDTLPGLATSAGSFIYWTSAKVLIWILPAVWLIRLSGRTNQQVFNFPNYKKWLLWGLGFLSP